VRFLRSFASLTFVGVAVPNWVSIYGAEHWTGDLQRVAAIVFVLTTVGGFIVAVGLAFYALYRQHPGHFGRAAWLILCSCLGVGIRALIDLV